MPADRLNVAAGCAPLLPGLEGFLSKDSDYTANKTMSWLSDT